MMALSMRVVLAMFLVLASLSLVSGEDNENNIGEKLANLKEDVFRKFTQLHAHRHTDPKLTEIFLQELENVLSKELSDDLQLRQLLLKDLFKDVNPEDQKNGRFSEQRNGVGDPFDSSEHVPIPR